MHPRRRRHSRAPSEAEELVADYRSLGLTLGRHPLRLLRERLTARRFLSARSLAEQPDRAFGAYGRHRHLPATARDGERVVFVTLEDETGLANIVTTAALPIGSGANCSAPACSACSARCSAKGCGASGRRATGRPQHVAGYAGNGEPGFSLAAPGRRSRLSRSSWPASL